MKTVFGAVVLMAIMIAVGVFVQNKMAEDAEYMAALMQQLEGAVLQDRFEEAEVIMSYVEHQWELARRVWSLIVDHSEMDYIKDSLVRLRGYIRSGDRQMSLVELSAAKYFVGHVRQKEAFSIESVF